MGPARQHSYQSAEWADYLLDEGDQFVPSMRVRPRRLMLRIGLEYRVKRPFRSATSWA